MTTAKHPAYDPEFPEQFNWELLDSPRLSTVAVNFASRIRTETLLVPDQRHCTAGLRYALNVIAENAIL